MIINENQITPEFMKIFNAMILRHRDECLFIGDSDSKSGFALLSKQKKEKTDLGIKYEVLINDN